MKVAIVGGRLSGTAIERAMAKRGVSAELFSRSSGFDVLRNDATTRLSQADVIVEATGRFTASTKSATAFFTRSTRAIATAARASGARHILLSIVNCELPEVQGYGYFAGKTAQERVAREESENLTIIRSTQWFEFAEQNLARMRFGPFALVPAMKIKPIALDAVADVIAECAIGDRDRTLYEVAGPEVMTLWEMTERVRRRGAIPVPLAVPGTTWRAFRDGALVPGAEVEQLGPRFVEWLAARSEQGR